MNKGSKYCFLSLAVIVAMSIVLSACGTNANGDLVKKAFQNTTSAKSYHADLTAATGSLSGDFDFANKNSKTTTSISGTNAIIIVIGGSNGYVSVDGGQNFIPSNDPSVLSSTQALKTQFDAINTTLNSGSLSLDDANPATETINGTSCKHVSGSGSGGTLDFWVVPDGSFVCQMKLSGTSGGTSDFTMKFSNVNGAIDIQAPGGAGSTGSAPAAVPTTDTSTGSGSAAATPAPTQY